MVHFSFVLFYWLQMDSRFNPLVPRVQKLKIHKLALTDLIQNGHKKDGLIKIVMTLHAIKRKLLDPP